MSIQTVGATVFDEISDEHQHLEQMLEHISDELAAGSAGRLQKIRPLFLEMTEELDRHFSHEEQGGYFAEIVEAMPRFGCEVERLGREHVSLLQAARELCRQAAHAEKSVVWNQAIQVGFEVFKRRCNEHEASENALVQDAYLQDIGALD